MRLQDPHFKASTQRRRIISRAQLADYAYVLAPGGMLYTITDVPELGAWMREQVSTLLIFRNSLLWQSNGKVCVALLPVQANCTTGEYTDDLT